MAKLNKVRIEGTLYDFQDTDLNGYKITAVTQSQYDALENKDANTIYLITA